LDERPGADAVDLGQVGIQHDALAAHDDDRPVDLLRLGKGRHARIVAGR